MFKGIVGSSAGFAVACFVLSVGAGAQQSGGQAPAALQRAEADRLNTPVSLTCIDGHLPEKPTHFLLSFHPGRIDDGSNQPGGGQTVGLNLVVHVGSQQATYPLKYQLIPGGANYQIDCSGRGLALDAAENYPRLSIRLETAAQKAKLVGDLRSRAAAARTGATVAPLLLSGDNVADALTADADLVEGVTYGTLVQKFVYRHHEAILAAFSDSTVIETLDPSKPLPQTVSLTRVPQRSQPNDTAAQEPFESQPQVRSGTAAAGGGLASPLDSRKPRSVDVRLAHKTLAGLDLAAPGVADTFGYCKSIRRDPSAAGAFKLDECLLDQAGTLPLRISGFEVVQVKPGQQPVRLDPLLRIKGYSTTLPVHWLGSAGDQVEVPGGPFERVLTAGITVRQSGIAGCEAIVVPALSDIARATLTLGPPPCSSVEISLPRNMYTAVPPKVTENCRPGSNAVVTAQGDGKVRCVTNQAEVKATTKKVHLLWGPGYAEIAFILSLTAGATSIEVPAQTLATNLRAELPPPDAQPAAPGTAAYKPAAVRYFAGQQPCGPALPLGDGGIAPSIGDAGCKTLPSRAEVTFELDRNNSDRTIAFEAFKQTTTASLPLGDPKAATARLTPPDGRLNLPVSFNAERQQRYTSQYVGPAELLIKGARIFRNENCQQTGNSVVELFEKGTRKPDYQWPVWAQVFDGEGRSMTDCARSIVEKEGSGGPYLTFDFVGTRAIGPRRAIVLARSQDLIDKPGMSTAIDKALAQFITAAADRQKKSGALSPVDILSVSLDGTMRRIMSGEDAALQSKNATAGVASMDRSGPKTVDLSLIRLQPETKGATRVLIIMDGLSPVPKQISELRLMISDLSARKNAGGVEFMLSGDDACLLWQPHSKDLKCVNMGAMRQSQREAVLKDTLIGFLNPP